MEDILCSSQADARASELQRPNTQQDGYGWRWTNNAGLLMSIFKIPSPLTSINPRGMWSSTQTFGIFQKTETREVGQLNSGVSGLLRNTGRLWTQPHLCLLQGWLSLLIPLSIRKWQSVAWSNTTPGQLSEDRYKYSQLKRKMWSFMYLVPNTCTIIMCNK